MQKNKNFPWVATPLALAISGFAAGNAFASVTTDTSFGTNGIASLGFTVPVSYNYSYNYPETVPIVTRQPIVELDNGDIVSFASRYEETGTNAGYWTNYYVCVNWQPFGTRCLSYVYFGNVTAGSSKTRMARFTADGAPISAVDIGGLMAVSALKQPDGKLVLMGNDLVREAGSWSAPTANSELVLTKPAMTSQIVLKRLNVDGSPDNTFDGDGELRIGIPGTRQSVGLALMQDGKIAVLSTDFNFTSSYPELWRFNSDGSIDSSFGGGDGNLPLPISNAWSMLAQQDNKFLVHYDNNNYQAYARFNTDGTLDSSFDGDGRLNINQGFRPYAPMLQQQDRKLLLSSGVVYRYDLNGSYEQKFMIPAGAPATLLSLAETPAGEVLVARGDRDNNGKVDVFYSNGIRNTTITLDQKEIPYVNYYNQAVSLGKILLQSNGLLLASGNVNGTATLNRHINFAPVGGDNDSDGIVDPVDNCPLNANIDQLNTDGDAQGNVCDADDDNDGVVDGHDAYPLDVTRAGDKDGDGVDGFVDNCPGNSNANQLNTDVDAQGDICDTDDDNDGVLDTADKFPLDSSDWADNDNDAIGDNADTDDDNDGVQDAADNCPLANNAEQLDTNANGIGNACDPVAGSLDTGFDAANVVNTPVSAAVQADGKIIIKGTFPGYIKRLNADGSLDSGFNMGNGPDNYVSTLALQPDGKILIVGAFASVNGVTRNGMARLNIDGSVDSSFDFGSGTDDDIRIVTLQADGKIFIAGDFTVVNGVSRTHIARLNANGSVDLAYNMSTSSYVEAVRPDGAVYAQSFNICCQGIENYSLRGPGFYYSNLGNPIDILGFQPDGKLYLYVTGSIFRVNVNGSVDNSFTSSYRPVRPFILQADGKIIVGNVRLNSNGSLDSSYQPGSGANVVFSSHVVLPDGKILIAGAFTAYNGVTRNYIARIHSGDQDGDDIEDAADHFPLDPTEVRDTDNDGLGDNADTDDDNDGMPDAWELQYGFNPLVNDANGDFDGDSISNLQEYINGTDPTVVNIISTTKNDYNHDGIAGWIWKGQSNGHETESQIWQLTLPLQAVNYTAPARSYPPIFPDQANWEIVTSGDFNNDGDADILWRNNVTAEWKVWQMQDGTRAAQNNLADFDLAHEWQVIGAGDTDKDGDDDIILNNITTGGVLIWAMHNHALAATHNVGSKAGYTLNRIGDFNKDGDVDLLFRQNGADALITWELEQNVLVQERVLAPTGAGYNPVCAGDFDNDGDDDIMLVSSMTQQEKWLVMENYSRTQKFGANNGGFVLLGCGDYDGDGDADSLWQRTSDDKVRAVLQQNWGVTKQTVYSNPFGAANGFVYRANGN